jgi:hypothetical protein
MLKYKSLCGLLEILSPQTLPTNAQIPIMKRTGELPKNNRKYGWVHK